MIDLYNNDCSIVMDELIKQNVKFDLIITDPPYELNATKGAKIGNSKFSETLRKYNDDLSNENLKNGIDNEILEKMVNLQDNINIYLWCNKAQIIQYLDFYVTKLGCNFDILVWYKPNAIPTYFNKYLTDKEYCLYFRNGGYYKPNNYEDAKTVMTDNINYTDKKKYKHPTIKPLHMIKKLIRNSSKEGDLIFDPFMGSGTTMNACVDLNRKGVGIEIDEDIYIRAKQRINNAKNNKLKGELF